MRSADELAGTLERFVARVPGLRSAMLVGSDGLLTASSAGVPRANADTAAAISTSLLSLAARSADIVESGRATLTMIEMEAGYIFLLGLTDGAAIIGHSVRPCDIGQIGYELAVLAELLEAARQ
jgi:uncharacterized protein